jgi:hypothetical protein
MYVLRNTVRRYKHGDVAKPLRFTADKFKVYRMSGEGRRVLGNPSV